MAKYCIKCGKPVPDGQDMCPDCYAAEQAEDAALFTRMTAQTEVWKTEDRAKTPRFRLKLPQVGPKTYAMAGGGALLVIVIILLILLTQPTARVVRALNAGDYDKALTVFWNTDSLREGKRVERIDKALCLAADKLCQQYAAGELDDDTAAASLAKLGTFGAGAAELLEDTYARFRGLKSSQDHLAEGERLFSAGEYLAAREAFLQVVEADADYETSRTRADACLTAYGAAVSAEAEALMKQDDYPAALAALKEGNDVLFRDYNTYSTDIDTTADACRNRYITYTLTQAEGLATLEEYDAAMAALNDCADVLGYETVELRAALSDYAARSELKKVADAKTAADALYADGMYEEAFQTLDLAAQEAPSGEAATNAAKNQTALSRRFREDMLAAAKEAFAGKRENLKAALKILDDAMEIRGLEELQTYRDDLASYLPLPLIEAEYTEKNGTVFRNSGVFESLAGEKYSQGWMWGEDGSDISFALNGAYDLFTCTLTVRREGYVKASGHFELWCDGELKYKSDTMYHFKEEAWDIEVDVSGCRMLKIVFVCDYTVSTTENGYCYHGICDPILTKNMEETDHGKAA